MRNKGDSRKHHAKIHAESSGLEDPRNFSSPVYLPVFPFAGVSTQQRICPKDVDEHKIHMAGHILCKACYQMLKSVCGNIQDIMGMSHYR